MRPWSSITSWLGSRVSADLAPTQLADWVPGTHERLAPVNLAVADRFALPLTQEMLANALGVTSVHVNQTLQALGTMGCWTREAAPWRSAIAAWEKLVHPKPARISADC